MFTRKMGKISNFFEFFMKFGYSTLFSSLIWLNGSFSACLKMKGSKLER